MAKRRTRFTQELAKFRDPHRGIWIRGADACGVAPPRVAPVESPVCPLLNRRSLVGRRGSLVLPEHVANAPTDRRRCLNSGIGGRACSEPDSISPRRTEHVPDNLRVTDDSRLHFAAI